MTDWETRYYEAQASHTEANGMLTAERDRMRKERDLAKAQLENGPNSVGFGLVMQVVEAEEQRDALRAYAEEATDALQAVAAAFAYAPGRGPRWYERVRNALAKNADTRSCTCHPDDNPPKPCPRKYALTECRAAAELRHQSCTKPVEPGCYVQPVPDHCDRITWRNRYWMLDERQLSAKLVECVHQVGREVELAHAAREALWVMEHGNTDEPGDAGRKAAARWVAAKEGLRSALSSQSVAGKEPAPLDYEATVRAFHAWLDSRPAGYNGDGVGNPGGRWFDAFTAGARWCHAICNEQEKP